MIARPDAATGGAYRLLRALLVEALFFHVVGEDDVGVFADEEIGADVHARFAQVVDFFQESRGIDDHAVADDGTKVRLQHAGGQKR